MLTCIICGETFAASTYQIKRGRKYCSYTCAHAGRRKINSRTHDAAYYCWTSMISRCTKSTNNSYQYYGARGVQVCAEWVGPSGFAHFIEHIGPRPSTLHQVDRINTLLGYEPGNVRWATPLEQGRNRRDNRLIEFQGESLCVAEWADRLGMDTKGMVYRLEKWPLEKALTTPKTK